MAKRSTLYSLIIISFIFGLAACNSDKTVEDDWPGVNEIRIQNEGPQAKSLGDSFNLNSKLSLPKMGSDVAFSLKTSCTRSLQPQSTKKKVFEKELSYPATEEVIKEIDIVEHLPAEVLIYPEFFLTCSFNFIATNQYGSTETSNLVNMKFKNDGARREINARVSKLVSELYSSTVIPKTELKDLTANMPDGFPIKNSKLLCYTNRLQTSIIFNTETKTILGPHFRLPSPTRDIPVEHCIIKGEHTDKEYGKDGQTVLSNRFSILNGDVDSTARIQLVNTITNHRPNQQFAYTNSNELDIDLIKIKINNNSGENVYFEFKSNSDFGDTYIINKLIKTSPKGAHTEKFKMDYLNIPSLFTWSNENGDRLKKTIHVNVEEEKHLILSAKPQFFCEAQKTTGFPNYELGFVIAPQKNSNFLHFRQVTKNDFLKDTIKEGNIFDLYSLRSGLQHNMPADDTGELRDNTAFQYFFRNTNVAFGKPLELSFLEPEISVASRATRDNPEPTAAMEKNLVNYTFRNHTHDHLSCSQTTATE